MSSEGEERGDGGRGGVVTASVQVSVFFFLLYAQLACFLSCCAATFSLRAAEHDSFCG